MSAYIFYGKAGSGKGTQAVKLKEYLESQGKTVLYIETGDLFRDFVANSKSLAAKRTREIIDGAGLMPPFFPIYLWANMLIQNYSGTEEIIFDGAARRIEEAQILSSALSFFNVQTVCVFHIHITDQTAVDRISIRGQGRADDSDTSKTMGKMQWFRDNVVPALDFWKTQRHASFAEINGEETVDGVWAQIKEVVD